jgi:hypothetical protein
MEARATRRPGQKGTKKLLQKFGDRLIFVRYRYDPVRRRRFTTVELIVDESPWNPPSQIAPPAALVSGQLVGVRIDLGERDLHQKVKDAGGRWEPRRGLWLLPLRKARALGLKGRLVSL